MFDLIWLISAKLRNLRDFGTKGSFLDWNYGFFQFLRTSGNLHFFGGGVERANWSTNNTYIWENHILEYHLDNYQRTLRRLFMEKIDQCEDTFEITVNHYNGKYKIHVEIPVVVQVLRSLEKEETYAGCKKYSIYWVSITYILVIHISSYIYRERNI